MDKFDIAFFRTPDGRPLYARVTSIGDRLTTLKAIGLGSVHRVRSGRVAKPIDPPGIDEMAVHNESAGELAKKSKEAKQLLRERKRKRLDRYDRDGWPTRYDYLDESDQ